MIMTPHDIARSIDASALKIDTTHDDLLSLVAACKQYDFGCAFIWQSYSEELRDLLKGTETEFGTSLGFPSGQETTENKVFQAKYFVSLGAGQIDMVMNVGWLKSGFYEKVAEDIRAVREACRGFSLKVIIEAMLLDDAQIIKACEIARDCGADYVKSGTGFSSAPTTTRHIALMKRTVGGACKIKAAGGIRGLDTLLKMRALGCDRFGIGLASAVNIMREAEKHPEGFALPDVDINKEV
ncbi:MAG: deoxyribose-phosphate aldolase [Clostridiales bacterium]|jgi:deoxyribose-phosphate aldolase|nr:deoxyribose-phosphate aldolase [Clostridiales bacterium]